MNINIEDYGFSPEMLPADAMGEPARVTSVYGELYGIVCKYGETFARRKTGAYYSKDRGQYPATGDFVLIDYNPNGDSQIIRMLERKSKFSRNDFSGHAAGYAKTIKEQVVAANFDYAFIMQSLNRDMNLKRLERYLTLAFGSGARPVVLLSKADLVEDCGEYIKAVEAVAAGASVHAISVKTGYGMSDIRAYFAPGSTSVFLGSSGVGKSSLVNALAGEELMEAKAIREDDGRGRHTTTRRQLFMLKCGAMVIDTPGMREIGMWDASRGVAEAFADVEAWINECRFTNCRHESEPGCAVRAAIERGDLSEERWSSYLRITRESSFVAEKSSFLQEKNAKKKAIAMENKRRLGQKGRNG
ncbi:MAG: ribosome small subunit-dependent GTPase A [Clostridia bacterium]|nr:ribosome small subunit-dependent GTPase A [Clostridia bacterium]